jgi:hypothetical protein
MGKEYNVVKIQIRTRFTNRFNKKSLIVCDQNTPNLDDRSDISKTGGVYWFIEQAIHLRTW